MAAAPTYMRSLSTFSAPHPHAAWSSVNSAARVQQSLNHHHHPHYHPFSYSGYGGTYNGLSINSHNTHIYTHHLQNFNPNTTTSPDSSMVVANSYGGDSYHHHHHQTRIVSRAKGGLHAQQFHPASAGVGGPGGVNVVGRRRSSSIRSRAPPPFIKFDPFADEPLAAVALPLPTESLLPGAHDPAAPSSYTADVAAVASPPPPSPPRRRLSVSASPFVSSSSASGPFSGPGNRVSSPSPIPAPAAPLSPILSPRPLPRSSPSPPPPAPAAAGLRQPLLSGPGALGGPNVSKLVAGIMLNRMSVGKPMRRRVMIVDNVATAVPPASTLNLGGGTVDNPKKREYVKSCLSSVVSVDA